METYRKVYDSTDLRVGNLFGRSRKDRLAQPAFRWHHQLAASALPGFVCRFHRPRDTSNDEKPRGLPASWLCQAHESEHRNGRCSSEAGLPVTRVFRDHAAVRRGHALVLASAIFLVLFGPSGHRSFGPSARPRTGSDRPRDTGASDAAGSRPDQLVRTANEDDVGRVVIARRRRDTTLIARERLLDMDRDRACEESRS